VHGDRSVPGEGSGEGLDTASRGPSRLAGVSVPSRHLLVTNDFPPKVGGIQSYLWELWRRLDPESFVVLTASSDPDASRFDAEQAGRGIRIVRVPGRILFFPTPGARRRVRALAREVGASLVVLDPALPLGLLGPGLGLPYAVVLHGAEVAVPGRLPVARWALGRVLRGASLAVSAGGYPAAEARRVAGGRMPPVVEVPPGVDCDRLVPLSPARRAAARRRLGLPEDGPLVASVSRLVHRKGMDVLVEAAGRLAPSFPDLVVAIGGTGREEASLAAQVRERGAPVRLLGRLDEEDKAALLGASDVFAMLCRSRWLGLEQEGFGIVFLEAAAAGVPQVAGDSGGAGEAVEDGATGVVVRRPGDPGDVALALRTLLSDPARRRRMGTAARHRAVASFDYAQLAPRLAESLARASG
jgi:phosphatidylinositol alpha-1,6-mannosyltransferase